MRVRSILATLLTASALMTLPLQAQQALTADPTPDTTNPASMQSFQLPSHGALLNALVYIAAGAGPHPTVLLLHGFPGNERNLDLAQTLRRAGYNVLYFNYRGSWGSPGDFSFIHCIEDTQAAIAYLHTPANAAKLRTDPNHLILMGHSMGGMVASIVASQEPPDTPVKAVALISAANMGGFALPAEGHLIPAAITPIATHLAAEGMAPLAGCTPESLARELILKATAWDLPSLAPKLARYPILILTSDDGLAPPLQQLAEKLTALHDTQGSSVKVTSVHVATDHAWSDHRIALQTAVLAFLEPSLHP